jgi:PAT family beta-lactamase induction signal transducer AmpG
MLCSFKQSINIFLKNSSYFFLNKKIILDSFLGGLINGTLLLISGNTLNFWLTSERIDLKTISIMTLVALPYSFKYLLAPLIDYSNFPFTKRFFSRNKSWIISSLFMCMILLIMMSFKSPKQNLGEISVIAFFIAFFAVILDLSLNSYRINTFKDHLNISSASYVCGYRFGLLISGAGAIYSSAIFSFAVIYLSLAFLCGSFMLIIAYSRDNSYSTQSKSTFKFSLYNYFILPFTHFGNIKNISLIFIFLILYRLPDNMMIVMLNPLYIDLGFNSEEIAIYSKFTGFFLALLGTVVTGIVAKKELLPKYLIKFLIIHSIAHLLYLPLIYLKNTSIPFLVLISAIQAFTGGLVLTIYISYMSSLCRGENTAIQYAVLFSLMGFGRTLIPSFSGYIASYTGWYIFFILITLINIPTILIFKKLTKTTEAIS